tara:strand:+ start:174028 stop:174276 length:249 start_codon:yes stop_codon:yes gene_type:complete
MEMIFFNNVNIRICTGRDLYNYCEWLYNSLVRLAVVLLEADVSENQSWLYQPFSIFLPSLKQGHGIPSTLPDLSKDYLPGGR